MSDQRTTVAVISDTHIPQRARSLPRWIRETVRAADYTIHAGDIGSRDGLDRLRTLTDNSLIAVSGDKDPENIPLPDARTVAIGCIEFCIIHKEQSITEAVRNEADSTVIGVVGHTHEPSDTCVNGVRVLNPRSSNGAHPVDTVSMIRLTIERGTVSVDIHERQKTTRRRFSNLFARFRSSVK